ncbi:Maf family protein [Deinococcus radiophilus]|uniref:dTTP/UTP pyrophosphatase n=1 Tax=Deinococcus radiophilus TaxID=32062 RepID=A0A3S0KBK2_9DEIO|nr:Maf family protein [Deinococcus radiophilus]RTR20932.1 septum formation protein Maf [Deinococcus radiophilus]UFA50876.1 Maf family protein [Deinococcus radiophilus]
MTAPLILASASPRRRELLGHLLSQFEVIASDADESSAETDPARLAVELARRKALAVAGAHPGCAVLGADTVVALGGRLLAKPQDEAENRTFIRQLSGQTHQVVTGLCLVADGQVSTAHESTAVTFRPLTDTEIVHYAASGEGLDKAGGYGIQGLGMALVKGIDGDCSNVVGLPLGRTLELLRGVGLRTNWD